MKRLKRNAVKAMMKPVKAWAIVENGKLVIYDSRLPITWLRKIAKAEMDKKCHNASIVQVAISIVKPRKKP